MATKYVDHLGSVKCAECSAFDKQHYPKCSSLRPFPIQNGGSVPWWLAEIAFEYYHDQWPGQSLERLAERGGFGVGELICFIRKSRDFSWLKTGIVAVQSGEKEE